MRRRASVGGELRTLLTLGLTNEADDATLLSLYVKDRDGAGEEAFRILVERHGTMVFRVCRQVIGDVQAAEDAAQAVFLVLARRAGSIRTEFSAAPWLHGVAWRVANKARSRGNARRHSEIRTAKVAASLKNHEELDPEDWDIVHEEVGRLPEKYRVPIVLCHLQGMSYEQAATRIGCPLGTVRVRLSRARDRLRSRLSRRGFGPERVGAIGLLSTDWIVETVVYGMTRVDATMKVVRVLGMGQGAAVGTVAASVLNLYQGVLRTMMIKQWLSAIAILLAIGITGAGAIVLAEGTGRGQDDGVATKPQAPAPPAEPKAEAVPDDPNSPATLQKHLDSRLLAARKRMTAQKTFYEEGKITIDRMIEASRQLMIAEISADPSREHRLASLKVHREWMDSLLHREQAELEVGRGTDADLTEAAVAYETAALEEIEALRSPQAADEVETLKRRVDALEKELEALKNKPN